MHELHANDFFLISDKRSRKRGGGGGEGKKKEAGN